VVFVVFVHALPDPLEMILYVTIS